MSALPAFQTDTLAPVSPRPAIETPFTLEHFRNWASQTILDTGDPWIPEDFQEWFVEDLFSGIPEVWLVVPEGNGKTTLLAGLSLYHCEFRPFASIHIAAASREQAEILYRQAEAFVLRTPYLTERVHSPVQEAKGKRKLEVPRFTCLEGYRRINHASGGRIQVFAADDRTGDGVIPTMGVIDEPHRQKDLSLYRTWSGKLAKRAGQIVAISTAGAPGSDFEITRTKIRMAAEYVERNGAFTRYVSRRVVMHEWALPDEADPDDIVAVKGANPFSGITLETLQDKHDSPTTTPNHWLRYTCNRAALDFDNWLGANAETVWSELTEPYEFVKGAPTWVGLDIGLKRDSTGRAMFQRRPDGRYHVKCRLWLPEEQADQAVDMTDVMQDIREIDALYDLKAVSFDPRFFDVSAKTLLDEGLPMNEVPQSVERMTTVVGDMYAAIMAGMITHDDDIAFTTQVMNAQPRFNDRGFTLAKGKSRGRIDAAVAMCLGYDRVQRTEETESEPEPFVMMGRAR